MGKPKLLIVDDIVLNRMLLGEIAKELGCTYSMANNGKEAIQILDNQEIDIVLMDIEMPVMNGIETTKYIRNNMSREKSRIPVIALTAHNPNDFLEEFNSAGFDRLLTKPYLISKIKEIINDFYRE